jgi:hypothetical protein
MPGENGAPRYRNQYIGRELGFKAPDPATSEGVRATILSQGPLEQSGVLQQQSGYTNKQVSFSGDWTEVRVASSASVRCQDTLGGLVYAGVDNYTPKLGKSACPISGEVVYLPNALSALSAPGVWRSMQVC